MTRLADVVSFNQATAEKTPMLTTLAACERAGITRFAPWRHGFIDGDATRTRRALDDHGLRASSLCRGGFFTGTRPDQVAHRDNCTAIEEAAILGAPVLVLVCGPVLEAGTAEAIARIRDGIERLIPTAREHRVTLGVEPFHPMFAAERSALVRLDQATDLVASIADPAVGVVADSYHLWWDPDLGAALQRAAPFLALAHIADWLVPTVDLVAGRGLPGDGVIDLAGFVDRLRSCGYRGPFEAEILNRGLWDRPIDDLVGDVATRMRSLVGAASGGRDARVLTGAAEGQPVAEEARCRQS